MATPKKKTTSAPKAKTPAAPKTPAQYEAQIKSLQARNGRLSQAVRTMKKGVAEVIGLTKPKAKAAKRK